MRIRSLLLVSSQAALCSAVLGSAACLSQTPAAPSPVGPSPVPPTPALQTPPTAVPAPLPQDGQALPSRPPYAQQPVQPAVAPAPTSAPQPSIAPVAPTPQAPYAAMPPYQAGQPQGAYVPYGVPDEDKKRFAEGSVYIPVDSWVYPEMMRLYSLGYVDTMFLSMRPWTRQSVLHMLDESEDDIRRSDSEEAKQILTVMQHELREEPTDGLTERGTVYGTKSVYTRLMGITGATLRDSWQLGQTIANDYGRPYQPGFNNLTGFETLAEHGRFSLYVRGEYQRAPSAAGYSMALSNQLLAANFLPPLSPGVNIATVPTGPIAPQNPFRLVEATLSFHLLGHEISGGKSDAWLGPSRGGALAWSNNAENIYSFRINRVEPLHIPYLSAILGPVRYDFFYGSLKGHTYPNSPYVHSEMFAFRPTKNFEFGFQRTIIFGGEGHEPVTLHTFLKGFFDASDTTPGEKYSRDDPGARFSDFNFSWRLPFIRRYATLYLDSIAHDDVTPISAPRRAAYRTGFDLSQIPGMRKLEFRAEAATTDPGVARSRAGQFNYYEVVEQQGYTNKGFIMGDWIGREAKGGQAWITYHLSGNEWLQVEYLNKKTPNDFVAGGTTQNQFKASVLKRFHHDDVELNAWFQYERWKAPIYLPGARNDTTSAVQLTFFPGLKSTHAH